MLLYSIRKWCKGLGVDGSSPYMSAMSNLLCFVVNSCGSLDCCVPMIGLLSDAVDDGMGGGESITFFLPSVVDV